MNSSPELDPEPYYGMRVIVGLDHRSTSTYTNQPGTYIGADGGLIYVVMDDPDLHDREYHGEPCAAFWHDDWRPGEHIIDELPA